ncbi:MAG TPA: tagaturonate reductase [Gemmatimonadaceae bacterium]|nr:tagaturonate reductase [Gemmatimonadaceae bacterium]
MTARPTLSPALVPTLAPRADLALPTADQLALPERAVQFGTGALLRGLVDALLDDANRQGLFGGRVVMIGSTGSGRDRAINDQGGLFTLVVQGLVDGAARRDFQVVSSVSRALAASTQWAEVLRCAENPQLEFIFSNTTEVGIALDESDAQAAPGEAVPRSFPAKLAAFLLHRARWSRYDTALAPIVIPTELIEDNGGKLREIVVTLARRWRTEPEFLGWLDEVRFCNTLVDRIVPGAPSEQYAAELRPLLPYEDGMITIAEPYRLFAIEGDAALRERLRFAGADEGVIVAGSITPYRLRKVRLLNGAHTSFVSLAILAGCRTVREAVEHPALGAFLRSVLLDEIVPSLDVPGAEAFAREVIGRFANPYLQHQLWDITLQGTTKFRVRVVPSILDHVRTTGSVPRALALGFAGFLAFQRGELHDARRRAGDPVPADGAGESIQARWRTVGDDATALGTFVRAICADAELWGADLAAVPGFVDIVTEDLAAIREHGAVVAIEALGLAEVR